MIKVELPIPASKDGSSTERPGARAPAKEEGMPDLRLKGLKVVAVDDNADSRQLLKAILERSSAEATVVSSGREALVAIKNVHLDVLICDLAKWMVTNRWKMSGVLNHSSYDCL
jgi:PleD family two-component response regulator